jgi:hypothetical protein
VADNVPTSSFGGSAPLTAAIDQDEDLGKGVADSFEADVGSTEGGHSVPGDSFFDAIPDSVPEEGMMFAGSTADADDIPEATKLNIKSADLVRDDLAIVAHAGHFSGHGRDGDDAVDSDAVPLSFSVPQTVLTSGVTRMLHLTPTPFNCVDREFIYVYSVRCVLICCRLWCLYSFDYGGGFSFWGYSSP